MLTNNLHIKKYLKYRVETKKCPTHNKSTRISVFHMENKNSNYTAILSNNLIILDLILFLFRSQATNFIPLE